MSRSDALYRAGFGIVYLPIYSLLLYPLVFLVSIVLTAIGLLYQLITGRKPKRKPRLTSGSWGTISQPVSWVFSGQASDKPNWLP